MNPINKKICLVIDFTQFKVGEGYAFNDKLDSKVTEKLSLTNNGKYEKTICSKGYGEIFFTNIHDVEDAKTHILDVLIELKVLNKFIRLEIHAIESVTIESLFHSVAV